MVRPTFSPSPHYILNFSVVSGAGITTTLIALIANAGPADQAIATAGQPFYYTSQYQSDRYSVVSYLFRSLGSVVGLSVGTTLTQATLRKQLHERLSGADVDEVRDSWTWMLRGSMH